MCVWVSMILRHVYHHGPVDLLKYRISPCSHPTNSFTQNQESIFLLCHSILFLHAALTAAEPQRASVETGGAETQQQHVSWNRDLLSQNNPDMLWWAVSCLCKFPPYYPDLCHHSKTERVFAFGSKVQWLRRGCNINLLMSELMKDCKSV